MPANKGKTSGPITATYRVVAAVPTGRYHLRVKNIATGERSDFRDKSRREPCIIWDFEITEHKEHSGKLLTHKTNTVYGNRSASLTAVLNALNGGKELTQDEVQTLDMREYRDSLLDAYVEQDDEGDGPFNRFDTFYPYKPDPAQK